jgi:hypothetical protein
MRFFLLFYLVLPLSCGGSSDPAAATTASGGTCDSSQAGSPAAGQAGSGGQAGGPAGQGGAGQAGLGGDAGAGQGGAGAGGATPAEGIKKVVAGNVSSCVISFSGRVKCWGQNVMGELGLGDTQLRGDGPGEMGAALPFVDLGTGLHASSLSTTGHACVLVDSGKVKCWGTNDTGELGLGDVLVRGVAPGDMGDALPFTDLGSASKAIAVGVSPTSSCALLKGGKVKCWGANNSGQLGQGDVENRGDNPGEMGDLLPPVDLGTGVKVTALAVGGGFNCAMMYAGIKCWGNNDVGVLGLGDKNSRGDDPGEMGDALPFVDVGDAEAPIAITAGGAQVCVLFELGKVKCWGFGHNGQLGQGDTENIGDKPGQMGNALPFIDLGTGLIAESIAIGGNHVCALLAGGKIKCWGYNIFGQLGLGDMNNRGDQPGEMGDNLPFVDLGTDARAVVVSAEGYQTCALLDSGKVKCWGNNNFGQLGLGDTEHRGDQPGEMGDALPFIDVGLP